MRTQTSPTDSARVDARELTRRLIAEDASYQTSDLGLAAYLKANGLPLAGAWRGGDRNRVVFVFRDTVPQDTRAALVSDYYNDKPWNRRCGWERKQLQDFLRNFASEPDPPLGVEFDGYVPTDENQRRR